MNPFSLGNAWSKGISFFSGQAAGHAIILIGVGILAPFVLQLVLMGGPMAMNPMMMASGGSDMMMQAGLIFLVVTLATYILQIGSYFGSWRLGLGAGESVAGALVFGLIAGVLAVVAFIALFLVFALVANAVGNSAGVAIVLIILFLIPLAVLAAILFTVVMALICVGFLLGLLIALAFGAGSLSQVNPSLEMLGGGAVVVLVMMIVIALLFWVTARFSCVTCYMAQRKTYNLIEAMGASWRMTAADQWRILAYLALLGVVLLVIFFLLGMIGMASMMGGMTGGGVPQVGMGMVIFGLIIAVPFAYLTVLVPAGIYRELTGSADSAQVFT